jgi:hypothetical protein
MKGHGELGPERRVFVSVDFQTRLGNCDEIGKREGGVPRVVFVRVANAGLISSRVIRVSEE